MKISAAALAFLGSLSAFSATTGDPVVFFEEPFDGPALDPSIWRTEIVTSGVRWCNSTPGPLWGPGTWVSEGSLCHGVAAYSPYGSADLSGGTVHLWSTNGEACPYLVSRLPGPVPLFPSTGDFTFTVRMRFDHVTAWGTFVEVIQIPSTEPAGDNPPEDVDAVLLQIASNVLFSSLGGGPKVVVAPLPSPTQFHEVSLSCVGDVFTIRIDDAVVYGPVTSTLRPTALFMGNPVLAFWYPTDWTWFTVDYIRVEVPGAVSVETESWGAIKAMFRD